jgi:hypothetical protein
MLRDQKAKEEKSPGPPDLSGDTCLLWSLTCETWVYGHTEDKAPPKDTTRGCGGLGWAQRM